MIMENVYSGTIDKPKNEECPIGSKTCCSFQREIANHTNKYVRIKNTLPSQVVTKIQRNILMKAFSMKHF